MKNNRENVIQKYIEAYNAFDVSKMIADFSDDIVFENIQGGEVSMILNGIEAFKNQAETAKQYFSERHQKIKSFKHEMDKSEIEIEYYGVLARDFPNGMKKGQEIKLNGKSIFDFKDGKIVRLTDIS
jgi:steroid delta-isomerase-like uncharacterized protein